MVCGHALRSSYILTNCFKHKVWDTECNTCVRIIIQRHLWTKTAKFNSDVIEFFLDILTFPYVLLDEMCRGIKKSLEKNLVKYVVHDI